MIVNVGTEINGAKGMIENVMQPGSEPGSPDYRADTLTTRPLKKTTMATWLIIEVIVASFERNFNIFDAIRIDHLTTLPLDR